MRAFEAAFGLPAQAVGQAPGRVNVLGEHTDYNGGFVLPTVIPRVAEVGVAVSADREERFNSAQVPGRGMDAGFAPYIRGCLEVLRQGGHPVPPLLVCIDSDVPIGAGLSSSAAIEVATLRAVRALLGLAIDDVRLALLAQEAEIGYAHVRCGIMDQMAASLGVPGKLLFIDTLTLDNQLVELPARTELLVLDSGVPRALATSGYNARRQECETAAALLGLRSLRELDDIARIHSLPEPLQRRVRHVFEENCRVLAAARGADARRLGALMDASHASLRSNFEVSVPAMDVLVGCLQRDEAVFGARLTGAGFGGACVALVRDGAPAVVAERTLAAYAKAGYHGARLV